MEYALVKRSIKEVNAIYANLDTIRTETYAKVS